MDEENHIKLKIMKCSVLPCGLEHTPFLLLLLCQMVEFIGLNIMLHSELISIPLLIFKEKNTFPDQELNPGFLFHGKASYLLDCKEVFRGPYNRKVLA